MPDVGNFYNANLASSISFPISSLPIETKTRLLLKIQAGADAFDSVCNVHLRQYEDTSDDNSSLDSCDAMYSDIYLAPSTEISSKKTALRSFCKDLQCNLVFSAGFDLASKKNVRFDTSERQFCYCYCPCGCKMAKWQQQFDQPQTCRSNTWMTPRGLLDHLKEFENDMYHNAVKYYLHNLYREQKNSARKNYSA